MLHFIPGWYASGSWSEEIQHWYTRRTHSEFDDTVKQLQLFHRRKVYPFDVTLLSYAPNFRHFLHRQGISHISYWSCFDAIQSVVRKKPALLSFHNLKWPEEIEFVYTMFVVAAMLHGELYAQIYFGEDGNPIEVEMFANGKISRKNIYDDRGFLSSSILYEEGWPLYQDYLTEKGQRVMRCFFSDGHVQINERRSTYRLTPEGPELPFSRLEYENLEAVLAEVLAAYLDRQDTADVFCTALHPQHDRLLKEALHGRQNVVSIYEDRCTEAELSASREMLLSAGHIICDAQKNEERLRRLFTGLPPISVIIPYDTRKEEGISQQLKVRKLLVPVDGLAEESFSEVIRTLGEYLLQNGDCEVHLFTRSARYSWQEKVKALLGNLDTVPMKKAPEETLFEEEEAPKPEGLFSRFFCDQCIDELSVSKCLREQRVIIDLRSHEDIFLRVMAISLGIPQIVSRTTEFVRNGGNGTLIKTIRQLPEALRYYLDTLDNWNRASIAAGELGTRYNTSVQVEMWREVIDSFGADSDSHALQ